MRQKPYNTRRLTASVLFLFFSGIIITLWLWDLSGSFPYRGVVEETAKAKDAISRGNEKFQELRATLGELKQQLSDALFQKK